MAVELLCASVIGLIKSVKLQLSPPISHHSSAARDLKEIWIGPGLRAIKKLKPGAAPRATIPKEL